VSIKDDCRELRDGDIIIFFMLNLFIYLFFPVFGRLRGTVLKMDDLIAPTGETWEAEQ